MTENVEVKCDSEINSEISTEENNFTTNYKVIPHNDEEDETGRIFASTPLQVDDSEACAQIDANSSDLKLLSQGTILPEPGSNDNISETGGDNIAVQQVPQYEFPNFSLLTKSANIFGKDRCLRGCKWSPDGTCLLVNCEDKSLRLFDLPRELYNKSLWNSKSNLNDISSSLQVTESGLIYDFDWYPFMSSWDQATSCFVSTSSNCPVHLYDAFTGQIRASYRGYDQYDEVAHAFCVLFSSSGTSIFCGYRNEIKIFDVSRPGRDCISINTKKTGRQKGIISCIADNPDMHKVYAAGSYRKTIGVYTVDGSSLCQLIGHSGGLTQVKFSPNGVRLYSAGRKDGEILCWDLRRPGKTLFSLCRPHTTNQRIYFDLSSDDKYLVSGSTDGKVRVWDIFRSFGNDNKSDCEITPHKDCINGVSLHRQLPILATSSGQRHVPDVISDDEDSQIFSRDHLKDITDNTIKLWWVGSTE